MTLKDYLKSKGNNILINIISLILLLIFMFSVGNTLNTIIFLLIVWIIFTVLFIIFDYKTIKNNYDKTIKIIDSIDKKYLITDLIEYPNFIEALPYYYCLKKSNKSMKDEINILKNQFNDYKDYIEQWVHEVKTPISSIKLIVENNKNDTSRILLHQLEEIDRYVEQVLFYARSEYVDKDYHIKEISLKECVNSIITKNKQVFLLNSINIELYSLDSIVYSDVKWIEFIINQILINSIKYRNNNNPTIKIYSNDIKNGIQLVIEDNGIGISKDEITRVFDKGFTGNKNRINNNSTGIGLYLCKKLCDRLGLTISIESIENSYTKVKIVFPKGSLCKF